jgi:hypothetical protein
MNEFTKPKTTTTTSTSKSSCLAIIAADEGGEGNLSCSPCGVYGRCVQYFATVESSSFLSYSFDQPTLACH